MVRRPIKDRSGDEREFKELKEGVLEMLGRRDRIKEDLDRLYVATEQTPEEISTYLNNPDHFTQNQWAQIQRYRSEIQQFLWTALGPKRKAEWEEEEKKRLQKKKKQKAVGSRRRGWIKMD